MTRGQRPRLAVLSEERRDVARLGEVFGSRLRREPIAELRNEGIPEGRTTRRPGELRVAQSETDVIRFGELLDAVTGDVGGTRLGEVCDHHVTLSPSLQEKAVHSFGGLRGCG